MPSFFNPDFLPTIAFAAYRYRFLFIYVVVGVLSLSSEIVVYRGLEQVGLEYPYCAVAGVLTGIFLAYWGNVRFNFKVPVVKRQRALRYFAAISFLSWGLQFLLRRQISEHGWSYEQARFLISGGAFGLAYVLHRKFSFADFKKVGVAVYANGIEDIKSIHHRIENFPDIIHVDLVDASYGREDHEVRTYRLEVVRAYWPRKPVHAHLMTRTPSRYLAELYPHVDRIYIHLEIDEDVNELLAGIRAAEREAGIALSLSTPLERVRPYVDQIKSVLFLAIPTAGSSGQVFQMSALERIAEFNQWPGRSRLDVCVDGGVNDKNVGLLNVEIVVSGSSVLSHSDPRRQVMRLQTSGSYEET